jgi:hypothetical protein
MDERFVSIRLDVPDLHLLPPKHSGLAVCIASHGADHSVRIREIGDGPHNRIQGELGCFIRTKLSPAIGCPPVAFGLDDEKEDFLHFSLSACSRATAL